MSSKNKLQEFCQRHQIHLPIYNTERDPFSPSHLPAWQSSVTVLNGKYQGEWCTKKSMAESSAAKVALSKLETKTKDVEEDKQNDCRLLKTPTDVLEICKHSSTIVFIDIENIPQAIDFQRYKNSVVIGIVGHCHSKAETVFPFYKYIVYNSGKDAVDVRICF